MKTHRLDFPGVEEKVQRSTEVLVTTSSCLVSENPDILDNFQIDHGFRSTCSNDGKYSTSNNMFYLAGGEFTTHIAIDPDSSPSSRSRTLMKPYPGSQRPAQLQRTGYKNSASYAHIQGSAELPSTCFARSFDREPHEEAAHSGPGHFGGSLFW